MGKKHKKTRKTNWEAESRSKEETQAAQPSTSQSHAIEEEIKKEALVESKEETQAAQPSTSQSHAKDVQRVANQAEATEKKAARELEILLKDAERASKEAKDKEEWDTVFDQAKKNLEAKDKEIWEEAEALQPSTPKQSKAERNWETLVKDAMQKAEEHPEFAAQAAREAELKAEAHANRMAEAGAYVVKRARKEVFVKTENKQKEERLDSERTQANQQSARGKASLLEAQREAKDAQTTLKAVEEKVTQKAKQEAAKKVEEEIQAAQKKIERDKEEIEQAREAIRHEREHIEQAREAIRHEREHIEKDRAAQDETREIIRTEAGKEARALLLAEQKQAKEELQLEKAINRARDIEKWVEEYERMLEQEREREELEKATNQAEDSDGTQSYESVTQSDDTESYEFVPETGKAERFQLVNPPPSVPVPVGGSIFGRGVIILLVVASIGGIGMLVKKLVSKPKKTIIDTKQNDVPGKEREEAPPQDGDNP